MKKLGYLFLLGGVLSLLTVLFAAKDWRAFMTNAQQPSHVEIKIDPKAFDEFVGQYSFLNDPEFVISFWREGDKFFLQATNQGRIQIYPESELKFFLKIFDASAIFVRDAEGKVTSLIWRQNGQDNQAKRISNQPAIEVSQPFEKREELIRVRDGVRLAMLIFTPKNQAEPLPILMSRTPYGIGQSTSDGINRRYSDLVKDGYIFVLQDIRGRYNSEGEFLMNRPMRIKKDSKSIDESTDTYDTIDWLIKNVPRNNGKVGIVGV